MTTYWTEVSICSVIFLKRNGIQTLLQHFLRVAYWITGYWATFRSHESKDPPGYDANTTWTTSETVEDLVILDSETKKRLELSEKHKSQRANQFWMGNAEEMRTVRAESDKVEVVWLPMARKSKKTKSKDKFKTSETTGYEMVVFNKAFGEEKEKDTTNIAIQI